LTQPHAVCYPGNLYKSSSLPPYNICDLLSGRAVRKHLAAAFHYLLGHHSAAAAYAPLSMESRDH
ncbi:MAG: hypothetical protein ACLTXS_19880, partial [[Clostridium] symbiosum]